MADGDRVGYRRTGAAAARAMACAREVAASCRDERELADRITGEIRGQLAAAPRWLSVGIGTNERHVGNLWRSPRPFQAGDLVKIEIGLDLEGYYVEVGETLAPWGADGAGLELIETCALALRHALGAVRAGERVAQIAQTIQETVEARGLAVSLYGAGHAMRVDAAPAGNRAPPWIFNRADAASLAIAWLGDGLEVDVAASLETRLAPGTCLSLEPIVQAGGAASERRTQVVAIPGANYEVNLTYWQTADGAKSAKFVHTVYVAAGSTITLTGPDSDGSGADQGE